MKARSRKLRRLRLGLVVLIFGFGSYWLVFVYGGSGPRIDPNASGQALERQVVALLKRIQTDWENDTYRTNWEHVPGLWAPAAICFPEKHAYERLVSEGSRIVDPLLGIARDKKYDVQLRQTAWGILGNFDEPRIMRAGLDAALRKELDYQEIQVAVGCQLPYSRQMTNEELVRWMSERMSTKTFEGIVLEALEMLIDTPFEEGGMYPGVPDFRVVRWLNRLGDTDIDEWLAQKAPGALEFRNRELRKGYDPACVFYGVTRNKAIDAVFTDPKDRKACRQLVEALHDDKSSLYPPLPKGYEHALRAWYGKNRSLFVYDWKKHRFVVKEKK